MQAASTLTARAGGRGGDRPTHQQGLQQAWCCTTATAPVPLLGLLVAFVLAADALPHTQGKIHTTFHQEVRALRCDGGGVQGTPDIKR
jgi:hypothetical protein